MELQQHKTHSNANSALLFRTTDDNVRSPSSLVRSEFQISDETLIPLRQKVTDTQIEIKCNLCPLVSEETLTFIEKSLH
jgi:hypothetical protein